MEEGSIQRIGYFMVAAGIIAILAGILFAWIPGDGLQFGGGIFILIGPIPILVGFGSSPELTIGALAAGLVLCILLAIFFSRRNRDR
uniref:DUF131 domain-containing protein n=1 Tax=Candidatus Methanomethylicus mesodigestus TaxID=1867258 RepID=A0A7C3F297_9CREN